MKNSSNFQFKDAFILPVLPPRVILPKMSMNEPKTENFGDGAGGGKDNTKYHFFGHEPGDSGAGGDDDQGGGNDDGNDNGGEDFGEGDFAEDGNTGGDRIFFEEDHREHYHEEELSDAPGMTTTVKCNNLLLPSSNGLALRQWHSSMNTQHTCESFEKNPSACAMFGHVYPNQGLTANHACCVCGGGVTAMPTPPRLESSNRNFICKDIHVPLKTEISNRYVLGPWPGPPKTRTFNIGSSKSTDGCKSYRETGLQLWKLSKEALCKSSWEYMGTHIQDLTYWSPFLCLYT